MIIDRVAHTLAAAVSLLTATLLLSALAVAPAHAAHAAHAPTGGQARAHATPQ